MFAASSASIRGLCFNAFRTGTRIGLFFVCYRRQCINNVVVVMNAHHRFLIWLVQAHTTAPSFLTRELRACARASYTYDVGNAIRSLARLLDWSIPVNFFQILGF